MAYYGKTSRERGWELGGGSGKTGLQVARKAGAKVLGQEPFWHVKRPAEPSLSGAGYMSTKAVGDALGGDGDFSL